MYATVGCTVLINNSLKETFPFCVYLKKEKYSQSPWKSGAALTNGLDALTICYDTR